MEILEKYCELDYMMHTIIKMDDSDVRYVMYDQE